MYGLATLRYYLANYHPRSISQPVITSSTLSSIGHRRNRLRTGIVFTVSPSWTQRQLQHWREHSGFLGIGGNRKEPGENIAYYGSMLTLKNAKANAGELIDQKEFDSSQIFDGWYDVGL